MPTRRNWFWPHSTAGTILLVLWLIVAFAASTARSGNPLDGALGAAIWYAIIMVVRALVLLVIGGPRRAAPAAPYAVTDASPPLRPGPLLVPTPRPTGGAALAGVTVVLAGFVLLGIAAVAVTLLWLAS